MEVDTKIHGAQQNISLVLILMSSKDVEIHEVVEEVSIKPSSNISNVTPRMGIFFK